MTQPSDRYLAEAVSQLAKAWARRSPAERSTFADQLAATSAPPEQPEGTDDALRTVRERAALSGAVYPAELIRGLSPEDAVRALDLLAPEFDRVHGGSGWKWTLRTVPRHDVLGTIAESGQLPDRLAEAAAIPTDQAGNLLRQLAETRLEAQGGEPDPSAAVMADAPATAVQALTWARSLGGFDNDLSEAQRRSAVRSLREGYDVLTRQGVFGRDAELAALRQFAEEPLQSDEAGAFPVLPLTGIGGAGKSTVLGAFVQPYLDRIEDGDISGPAVVVLDFDRVLFRPGAELELSFELTRQLGYAAPTVGQDLAQLRDQVLLEQRQSGSDRHVDNVRGESTIRLASGFERAAGELIRGHGLADRPVLLVLDTFEEWQRESLVSAVRRTPGNAPADRILSWIYRAHTVMGLRNLRVVVSGRADLHETEGGGTIRRPVVIGDLDNESARELLRELLRALGVTGPDAARLADRAGGNPLTLHVAARFYLGLSRDERRDFLAGDARSDDAFTTQTRNEFLYGRLLSHIPDGQVRKLAYPGLLLRRVTPELVRRLLAGPCGLGELTGPEAVRLTERLAAEAWLVRADEYGLYHRKEVRKPMLPLMASDPRYAAVARQIHAAAARWYEGNGGGRDQLPRDRAQVEALYHQLMLATGDEPVAPDDEPDREHWLLLTQALGDAVDELPAKVAAQVHVLRGDQVPDSDAKSLPGPVWELWIAQRGATLVDAGEPAAALELFDMRPANAQPKWLARACSDAGQWDRYWRILRGLSAGWPADECLSSDRYALLNALLSPELRDLDDYRSTLARYFRDLLDRSGGTASCDAERMFCALLCELGVPAGQRGTRPRISTAVLLGPEAPIRLATGQGAVDRFPVDQLRRLLTWMATPSGDPGFVVADVASFSRPDPQWMRDFAAFTGISGHDGLDSYLARVDRATPGMTSDQALGEWAIGYERALRRSEIRLSRPEVREAAALIHVLRGDNPELRPAIQLALAGPAAAGTGLRELAEIAERVVPVPAADLRPSALTTGTRSDVRTLIQLVEYVDRSGVMRDFLTEARRAWPQAELLHRVADAFGTWDDTNNRLLDALANRLQNGRG
jgi:hypothetical protein